MSVSEPHQWSSVGNTLSTLYVSVSIPHMLHLWLICTGGYDYMHTFSRLTPLDVVRSSLQMGDTRTATVTDGVVDTCFRVTYNPNRRFLWAKVLPFRAHLFGKLFSVFIAGENISCSPIDGILVALQPVCDENGQCENTVPCIARKAAQKARLLVCEYQCKTIVNWNFVAVYINHLGSIPIGDLEICEIWFSTWCNLWVIRFVHNLCPSTPNKRTVDT